jgi:hypothetical protein
MGNTALVDEIEAFKGLTDEAARVYLDTGELQ